VGNTTNALTDKLTEFLSSVSAYNTNNLSSIKFPFVLIVLYLIENYCFVYSRLGSLWDS